MIALNSWGPSAWHFIHAVCHTFPNEPTERQRQEMVQFLRLFGRHLPCPKCRKHYESFMKDRLRNVGSADRLFFVQLLNDCHNSVNERRNQRSYTLKEHYKWMSRKDCSGKPWNNVRALRWSVVTLCLINLATVFSKRSLTKRLPRRARRG